MTCTLATTHAHTIPRTTLRPGPEPTARARRRRDQTRDVFNDTAFAPRSCMVRRVAHRSFSTAQDACPAQRHVRASARRACTCICLDLRPVPRQARARARRDPRRARGRAPSIYISKTTERRVKGAHQRFTQDLHDGVRNDVGPTTSWAACSAVDFSRSQRRVLRLLRTNAELSARFRDRDRDTVCVPPRAHNPEYGNALQGEAHEYSNHHATLITTRVRAVSMRPVRAGVASYRLIPQQNGN